MTSEPTELKRRERRRNAAALQQYLKRNSPAGFSMGTEELERVARHIQAELSGTEEAIELVRQAWIDLIWMGLVSVDPSPGGPCSWRLADVPAGLCRVGSPRPGSGSRP